MEVALNVGWVMLAVFLFWKWLPHASSDRFGRGIQLVSLTMLVLILFPVISVTDDLQASHNPAEIERSLRRDQIAVSPHVLVPAPPALLALTFCGILLATARCGAPERLRPLALPIPACFHIFSRPPPRA